MLVWIFLVFLFCTFVFTNFTTGFPLLDWYSGNLERKSNILNKILTPTSLHIVETTGLFWCLYTHRHFPSQFSLFGELLANLIVTLLLNWFTDLETIYTHMSVNGQKCFGFITLEALIDICRATSFIIIGYIITKKKYSPAPFTWVFDDFSKFIFEPTCIKVFMKYLQKKEPGMVDVLNKMMRLYNLDFDRRKHHASVDSGSHDNSSGMHSDANSNIGHPHDFRRGSSNSPISTGSRTLAIYNKTMMTSGSGMQGSARLSQETPQEIANVRSLFLELMDLLEPSFENFKNTGAAAALYKTFAEFERVSERSATF